MYGIDGTGKCSRLVYHLVAFSVEQSSNGTTGWSTMINILSTNGTNTQTFTPTQPYVRVKFLSGNAYSLADMTMESVDVDTSYSLIARGSYRYGFNNKEKDDELKGNVGTFLYNLYTKKTCSVN